jgi:hypothetical protein
MRPRFFAGVYPESIEGAQNDIRTQSPGMGKGEVVVSTGIFTVGYNYEPMDHRG